MVCIIGLALASAALLGVGHKGGFSSHIVYTLPIARLDFPNLFWYKVYSNHLDLSEKTWGLRSALEVSPFDFRFQMFPEEDPKFTENSLSLSIPHKLLRFFFFLIHQSSCLYPSLLPGWYFPPLLSDGFLRAMLVSKVSLFSWGSKILGGTAPCLQAISWEVFSAPSFFVVQ